MNTKHLFSAIVALIILLFPQFANSQDNTTKETKLVALTFDDGPNTVTTAQVLDRIEKYNVVASFFLIGNNINDASAEMVKRADKLGCEIANHSRSHSYMTRLSAQEIADEVKYTSDKIESIIGKRPKFFRPPYINLNQTMYDNIDLTFICGIMTNDWMDTMSAEQRYQMAMKEVKDGTLILMHDMEGNSQTVEALDLLIPELLKQGYKFVTVSELFKQKGITPQHGIIYSNVFQEQ